MAFSKTDPLGITPLMSPGSATLILPSWTPRPPWPKRPRQMPASGPLSTGGSAPENRWDYCSKPCPGKRQILRDKDQAKVRL